MKSQIICLGGGGFSEDDNPPLLDNYILHQSRSSVPRVCFLPTASGDSKGYVDRFYDSFKKLECIPSHLSLFKPSTSDLASFCSEKDVIYVGGGNTRNMLVLWKEWGLDRILKSAWESGILLCGLSAGSICWFEQGLTDSIPGKLGTISGLGFVQGSHCPHYDSEPERKLIYRKMIDDGSLKNGFGIDDGVALHFTEGSPTRSVTSRIGARAYRLEKTSTGVTELPIIPSLLDAGGNVKAS